MDVGDFKESLDQRIRCLEISQQEMNPMIEAQNDNIANNSYSSLTGLRTHFKTWNVY